MSGQQLFRSSRFDSRRASLLRGHDRGNDRAVVFTDQPGSVCSKKSGDSDLIPAQGYSRIRQHSYER